MTEDFCKRTAGRTRKPGYDPKEAALLSRFCYVSMLSVGGVMLLAMRRKRAEMVKVPKGSLCLNMEAMPSFEGMGIAGEEESLRPAMPDFLQKSLAGAGDEHLLCLPARARSDVPGRLNRWYGHSADFARASITGIPDTERRLP
jgi:hypothetical protein